MPVTDSNCQDTAYLSVCLSVDRRLPQRRSRSQSGKPSSFGVETRAPGAFRQGTAEHAPSPLFCSVLACSGAPAEQTRFVLLCHPVTPRWSRRAGGRRDRGWARKRGPLGARPPSPGPRGSAEACGGGDQAKIRGLSDKICSAGGRSLAICAPSAQSARRRH